MKTLALFLTFSLFIANSAIAAINGLTRHSRANCINNESISWDMTTYRNLGTVSNHMKGKDVHHVTALWAVTLRSAALHWGEGNKGGYRVIGYHWIREGGQDYLMEVTDVGDCSIYDGWWECKSCNADDSKQLLRKSK